MVWFGFLCVVSWVFGGRVREWWAGGLVLGWELRMLCCCDRSPQTAAAGASDVDHVPKREIDLMVGLESVIWYWFGNSGCERMLCAGRGHIC